MLFAALVVSVIIAIIGTIRMIRNRDWRKAVLRKAAARDERGRALGQDMIISDIDNDTIAERQWNISNPYYYEQHLNE